MPDNTYLEPLNKFLELGHPETYDSDEWIDYVSEYNLTDEHIPDLLKMLEKYTQPVENFDGGNPESWTAIHVWRALGQLKNETAVQPLVDAMERHVWNEWDLEDIPQAIGLIGGSAIEILEKTFLPLAEAKHDNAIMFQSALEIVAKQNPEWQNRVVDIFIELLENAEKYAGDLNGFTVCALMDLKIERALPAIEAAYAGDFVDTSICGDWEEVQVGFGLLDESQIDKEAKNKARAEQFSEMLGLHSLMLDEAPKNKADKKKKKKRKQAQKSRKQNRKKKK